MSERDKMLAGLPFNSRDPELLAANTRARGILQSYNAASMAPPEERHALLSDLLGACGEGVWIEPPFFCDYGTQIRIGDRVFMNFNCVILDANHVTIGTDTLIGPGVQIYATDHPLPASERLQGQGGDRSYVVTSKPVTIGAECWIGGRAIILPGVTIGQGTTIGAGSVVTKSIPAGVFAAGNPCRVLRNLDNAP